MIITASKLSIYSASFLENGLSFYAAALSTAHKEKNQLKISNFGSRESRKLTESEKSQEHGIEIRQILDKFKIRSISNLNSYINEQPDIKQIAVIKLKSKSTNTKQQQQIITL